jgi:murein DD-endopeptidase MepM/ murein hydrolase activator NlpD
MNYSNWMHILETEKFDYVNMVPSTKDLLLLPREVKLFFIREFESFTDNEFVAYLDTIDNANWGSGQGGKPTYTIDSNPGGIDHMVLSNGTQSGFYADLYGEDYDEKVEEMYKYLLDDTYTLVSSTPKMWWGIHKKDFSNYFNMTKEEFDGYIEGWHDGFKEIVDKRLETITEQSAEEGATSSLDDSDIKLSLYRSLKSIYDKWISRSDGEAKLFYNNVSNIKENPNENDEKTLMDHYEFNDRAMNYIGDEAIIDITHLMQMVENRTVNLWETSSNILSKNNFDFFALPTHVDFGRRGSQGDAELKAMFDPQPIIDKIVSSPKFVAVFNGGNSRSLDIGPKARSWCEGNKEVVHQYENDGIDFKKNDNGELFPPEFSTEPKNGEGPRVTAFLVKYGSENQSHFKNIQLDQAEFRETQESLMVVDQIAKGGDSANRTSKGQNLYDVYLTRSYTCEVEALGNMMIQPLQYFQLENVPMFHGGYLITEVEHQVKPHNVTTKFKGTRVPVVTVPFVKDAVTFMNLADSDIEGDTTSESLKDIKRKYGQSNTSDNNQNASGTPPPVTDTEAYVDSGTINELDLQYPIIQTVDNNGQTFDGVFITSATGARSVTSNKNASSNHKGVDMRAAVGTNLYAVGDAEIDHIRLRTGPNKGFGLHVVLALDVKPSNGKRYKVLYGHMSNINPEILDITTLSDDQISRLKSGGLSGNDLLKTKVKKGDFLGLSGGVQGQGNFGSTDFAGSSKSPHLHFEMREGDSIGTNFYSMSYKDPIHIIDPEGTKTRYKPPLVSPHGDTPSDDTPIT